ncbi:MAG: stage II sporulation protein M [Chloroflexota bacterium]
MKTPAIVHDLQMAWIVTRRELRDAVRDWRIVIPMLLLTLGFPSLMNYTAARMLAFVGRYGAQLMGDRLIPFLLLVVGFFPMSFSLVIALETFVGERERNSLEPLLATPLTDAQLYVGKALAALIPPLIASLLGITVYLLGLLRELAWQISPILLGQLLLLTVVQGMVMVSGAVIVSSQTTSVRAANLLASFIIIPMALMIQFEAAVMFWGNHNGLWWLIVGLAITAVIFVRMGIRLFNREELLGREIDHLRLGWMVRHFWWRLSGRAERGDPYPSLAQWYRQLFALLPPLRLPAAVVLFALAGGLLLGRFLAGWLPLPGFMQTQLQTTNPAENLANVQNLLSGLPMVIFLHNLRAAALQTILGMFTFGVLGLLVFMLPWALVGYMTSQVALVGYNPLTFVLATIAPHASLELPALVLLAAAALRWQVMVIAPPPQRTVTESWLFAAADFGRLLIGLVIPLLILAALLEAFVTPAVMVRVYGG